jgi:uncharacterized protein
MNNVIPVISARTRYFEIAAVALTGIGKLVFVDVLKLKFYFIIVTILFWSIYFFYKTSKDKTLVQYWGLSLRNSFHAFRFLFIVAIPFIILFPFYAYLHGIPILKWNVVFVLITYPVWGLVQQFLMMSLFAGNLKDIEKKKMHPALIVVLTSIVFSIVHIPSVPLVIVTFFMAIFYTSVFLKYRSVIPLGIFHGILGGLFYYYVLNRDAWAEFLKAVS